ncbi:MAG: VCBS repeat-containing protein [Akkermansiaceae bacterium]|nr:VCBS repeat-containing protein [Akkermansiaceae bacterium]
MKKVVLILISSSLAHAEGPWARHTIDDSSKGADGIRLADINGDGLPDIATGWEEGGIVRAYLHPGKAKAKQKWPAVTVGKVRSAEDAVFADLDGDGAADVVSSCEGGTKSMFIHWAPKELSSFLDASKWITEAIPATARKQAWMYALPIEIDGRNGLDLIVGSKGNNGSIGWLQSPKNARDLSNWKYHKLQDAGWIMSLIAIDMNKDGRDDILVSDRKGQRRGIYWLERPEASAVEDNQKWRRRNIGGQDREIKFISHGDLDQDGVLDIIAIDKKSVIWFRAHKTGWSEHVIPLPKGVGGGKSAVILDVNLDGRNDIVFSCEEANGPLSGMRWLSWRDSPFDKEWQSHEIAGEPGVKYDQVIPYDVDGDSDLDILCCEERDQLGVFWYENPSKK